MPVNYFVGRSRQWLESELRAVQDDIAAGKTVTSYGAGDISSGKQVEINLDERWRRLYYALYLLAPLEYPLSAISKITVTVGRHNAGRWS